MTELDETLMTAEQRDFYWSWIREGKNLSEPPVTCNAPERIWCSRCPFENKEDPIDFCLINAERII